jgi:signal transduction histidine kinase
MQKRFGKVYAYIRLKTNSVTIKQANIFTTFFIFLFTIVFAYLLITENYHDYERALTLNDEVLQSNNIDEMDKDREHKLKTLLIKNTIAIATLAFILFAIMLGFYKIFNNLIQRDMQAFLDFFRDTAHNEQVLNPNAIFFKEFKTMVGYANEMVDTINEQKFTLQELNAHLEEKVKAKTADLVKINEKLLKEKKFSEDILNAQKEFLRHTVHETNTPLSVMLTSIELFVMNNKKDRQLSKIEAAAKNIFNIYDDLSYLVKKDQVTYPKVAIELNRYILSRIDFFTEVAELSKLTFDYIQTAEESYIYFNETKLQRIVDNTITNAIKYTIAYEVIEIKLEQNFMYVDLSVCSKSREIKDKEKIFSPFYREERHREGFGIGLRLVKGICDEEDVIISLDSNIKKTTFKYRFKAMGE